MSDRTYAVLDVLTGLPISCSIIVGLGLLMLIGQGAISWWGVGVWGVVIGGCVMGQIRLEKTAAADRARAAVGAARAKRNKTERLARTKCRRCGEVIWKPRTLCDVCRGGKISIEVESADDAFRPWW
jgi:hypothetical protein